MTSHDFQTVCQTDDIPEGEGRAFHFEGTMIAIFQVDGKFYAINDFCPHQGASLAEGYVENGGVMCPWHAWKFCVRDGTWLDNPGSTLRAASYPVRVVENNVQVMLPPPPAPMPTDNADE